MLNLNKFQKVIIFAAILLASILIIKLIRHIFIFYPKLAIRVGKPIPVEVEKVKKGKMSLIIWGTGTLESLRRISYSVNFEGIIQNVLVKRGDIVDINTPLLKIDSSLLKKELEAKEKELQKIKYDIETFKKNTNKRREELKEELIAAEKKLIYLKKALEQAKQDLEDAKELYQKEMISLKELREEELKMSETEASYKQAQGDYLVLKHQFENFDQNRHLTMLEKEANLAETLYELSKLKFRFNQTIIKSTVKGYVSQILVNAGEKFKKNQELITVSETDPIFAKIFIAQEFSSFIRIGQKAKIFLQAWPKEEFLGEIQVIEAEIEKETKSLPIWVRLKNKNLKLRPGLSVYGIIKKDFQGLLIPEIALMGSEENPYVFVVKNDTAKIRRVKIFVRNGKEALVLSGLSEGEEVVVAGQLNLIDGIKVLKNAYSYN